MSDSWLDEIDPPGLNARYAFCVLEYPTMKICDPLLLAAEKSCRGCSKTGLSDEKETLTCICDDRAVDQYTIFEPIQ